MEAIQKANLFDTILSYQNEDITYRFSKLYDISEEETELIFKETKKWLWLCYETRKLKKDFSLVIDDSLLIIDEMWHNFILFTKDYTEFCMKNFGYYIHHQPTKKSENDEWKKDPKKSIEKFKENLASQYNYVYDYLGEETLKTWYLYFDEKYTKEYLKEITK